MNNSKNIEYIFLCISLIFFIMIFFYLLFYFIKYRQIEKSKDVVIIIKDNFYVIFFMLFFCVFISPLFLSSIIINIFIIQNKVTNSIYGILFLVLSIIFFVFCTIFISLIPIFLKTIIIGFTKNKKIIFIFDIFKISHIKKIQENKKNLKIIFDDSESLELKLWFFSNKSKIYFAYIIKNELIAKK